MNKIKKAGYLCGLLSLSLYTNVAYAGDKIYDGVIAFSCNFKVTSKFSDFINDHNKDKDLGKIIFAKYKDEHYFSFSGSYDEKDPKKKLELSFINNLETDLDQSLDSYGKPIVNTVLITGKVDSNRFQLSLHAESPSRPNPANGIYVANADFFYNDTKFQGKLHGECNFSGTLYSEIDPEDDENVPSLVVVHPKDNQ